MKKETALVFIIVAFVAGVVLGVVLTVLHQGADRPGHLPVGETSSSVQSSPAADAEKKIEFWRSALQKDPKNLKAWIELGNAYFDADQYDPAIEAYSRALEIDPGNADVRTDRGIMYRKKGDLDRAIREFRKAADDDPKHVNSRYNLGLLLLHDKGDIPQAIQAWEDYLKLNPKGPQAENIRRQVNHMKTMTK